MLRSQNVILKQNEFQILNIISRFNDSKTEAFETTIKGQKKKPQIFFKNNNKNNKNQKTILKKQQQKQQPNLPGLHSVRL